MDRAEQPAAGPDAEGGRPAPAIEVLPVVVVSRSFPARPSSIPGIRDFVRDCLARAPLTPDEHRQVDETVSAALLEAAGPTGVIEITFRIFPDHVEVDVLRGPAGTATAAPDLDHAVRSQPAVVAAERPVEPAPDGVADRPWATFAEWMADALTREGLTREAAARRLGVSVKTIGRWVGGATEPRLRDLRRIREVFGPTPFS
jgi:DNA-binding XRE family transcriptional regulator